MATIANLLVIILEAVGLSISIPKRRWQLPAFYTQLSNLAALTSSLVFLLPGIDATQLRYLSSCMLTMTFLITLFVLVPMGGGFKELMISGNGLYHHTLCPILSVASYILWEPHGGSWIVPTVVTTVYGLVMLYLNAKGCFDGPYPFFKVHEQSVAASILWTLGLICFIAALSLMMGFVAQ